jgi:hypothetical protein
LKHLKNLHGFFVSFTLSASLISALLFSSCQKGNQGAAGATGAAGAAGTQGATGNTILSGDGTPSSTLGNNGDYYLELDSSNLYGPKTSAGWGSPVSMTGASGAVGTPGAAGTVPLVDTFSVKTADWTTGGEIVAQFASGTGWGYPAQIYTRYNSNITAGILDSGMVLVYFTPAPGFYVNQWLSLPYSIAVYLDGNSSTSFQYNYSYIMGAGQLSLEFYLTPLNTAASAMPNVSTIGVPDAYYKIVVIPGILTHEIIDAIHKKVNKMGQISID